MSGPYSVLDYGLMTVDRARMDPYIEALRRAVTPGCVVVDIGTGAGIFAVYACRFGARKVYAIDPDEVVQVGREIAAANGYADRIEFIQQLSTDVELAERADVVISDLRGVTPLFAHHIPAIVDARKRLLAPDGVLIPQRDTLRAALVSAPELRAPHVDPWRKDGAGPDLTPGLRYTLHVPSRCRVTLDQLLVQPQSWGTLDYATVTTPDLVGTLRWTLETSGTAHGVSTWFDAQVLDALGFSSAPGSPAPFYGMLFLPFLEPVSLVPGDTVEVTISAQLVSNDYDWGWHTRVVGRDSTPSVKADFRQHSFLGSVLSPDRLKQSEPSFVPRLGEDGRVERQALDWMNGRTSLGEIASRLENRFPGRFRVRRDALTYASDLARRLCRADYLPGATTLPVGDEQER